MLNLLPPALASFIERAARWVTGRPPEPPSFDGLLEELFAAWPLDAVEYGERSGALPQEQAA